MLVYNQSRKFKELQKKVNKLTELTKTGSPIDRSNVFKTISFNVCTWCMYLFTKNTTLSHAILKNNLNYRIFNFAFSYSFAFCFELLCFQFSCARCSLLLCVQILLPVWFASAIGTYMVNVSASSQNSRLRLSGNSYVHVHRKSCLG